jgi:peptidoglycan/LPS O-acetylase OafA/YrhL
MPRWLLQQDSQQILSSSDHDTAILLEDQHEKLNDESGLASPGRSYMVDDAWPSLRKASQYFTQTLLPSALKEHKSRQLHPTSWLDGLRGIAAFFVVLHHGSQQYYRSMRPGYGSSPEAVNIIGLPILRIIISGGAMVAVFFVISGYVLSTKALKLSRSGKISEVYENVASATFRRGPRLYIPTLTIIFLSAMAGQLEITDQLAPIRYSPASSLWEQLRIFLSASSWFITPFGPNHHFEPNSWTIPIEFKGSLLVFLFCMGMAKCTTRFRFICLVAMTLFWLWHGVWELYLFSGGMLAADLHLALNSFRENPGPSVPINEKPPRRSRIVRVMYAFAFVAIMYLLSIPENDEAVTTTPGYITLATSLTPSWWMGGFGPGRWWPCLSSLALVMMIDHAGSDSIYQSALTSRIAQYLGDVSFCLYLVHGPMLNTVISRLVRWTCTAMDVSWDSGRAGQAGPKYFIPLAVGWIIGLPLTLWVAEIATNLIDRPSVAFTRKMMVW